MPGNHEYDVEPDLALWRSTLEEHGVEILINQGRRLMHNGESLWLAGVDDLSLGRPNLPEALRGVSEDEPILLLSHHPDRRPRVALRARVALRTRIALRTRFAGRALVARRAGRFHRCPGHPRACGQ